jgi:hypothetical protein
MLFVSQELVMASEVKSELTAVAADDAAKSSFWKQHLEKGR